jgi:hypothetical protein
MKWCVTCKVWGCTECGQGSKRSLEGISKTCTQCKRNLSSRMYVYSQHSPDKLRDICRTCESHIPNDSPSLTDILSLESQLAEIVGQAAKVHDPTKERTQFERHVYLQMKDRGLLTQWKPPIWIHKTSKRK